MEPTAKHVISFKAFYGEPVSKQYKGKYRNEFVEMQKKEWYRYTWINLQMNKIIKWKF